MESNERLRGAIFAAGLTPAEVAQEVGVDPKTVERWIATGRAPHRTHRLKAARLLGADDTFLWPSTANDPQALNAVRAELVTLYPNRGAVPAEQWFSLTERARESIDILAFAASFLHDALPGYIDLLKERARAGVRVRLLLGDPESEAVALRGREEGIDDLLASRCALSWRYLQPLRDVQGVEARAHGTTLYNSIFRFDNAALINTHSIGAAASHSPILHIQRVPGGRLLSHYLSGFDKTWDEAAPRPL